MTYTRGFTLIEVLAALAVVGIAMLALVSTTGQYTRQSADLRERTVAQWVAVNRLAEYRIDGVFPEPGTETGDVVQAGERWIWRALVSPAPGEDDLRRIDIAVSRPERPDAPVVTVTGFVGRVVGFVREAPTE
ncbi:MAG: type II secretion system minor pseudopilin GspI [Gammaproteobacteria bacterium]